MSTNSYKSTRVRAVAKMLSGFFLGAFFGALYIFIFPGSLEIALPVLIGMTIGSFFGLSREIRTGYVLPVLLILMFIFFASINMFAQLVGVAIFVIVIARILIYG